MADTKISALPSGAPAQATDETVIARGGANYKLTVANIVGYLGEWFFTGLELNVEGVPV
jgi:hypothetical protein